MKVLHFYKASYPSSRGGVESFIHQLAIGGLSRGLDCEVLSISSGKKSTNKNFEGYKIYEAPISFELASTPFSYAALSKFKVLASSADIIHYHYPWPFMDMVHSLCGLKKKSIVTYHSDIIKQKYLLQLYKPLKRHFLSSVDCIVASSPNYLLTSDILSRYSEKVEVIPYGLDKTTYPVPQIDKVNEYRKKYGERFFLFLGVLRYYKGLHILIEAAIGTDFPIVIAGAGPIESELKKRVDDLGINNIHFLGFVSEEEKVSLLQSCYAMVFPSDLRSEAFGISLLEAAMFGKPMISSEIGTGTTFVNIDGQTGLAVIPSYPLALRDAMTKLWCNPNMAIKMGKAAEVRFRELFTAEKMVGAYSSLYQEILAK